MMMACEECCRNCQLAHGKKNDLSPSVSRFAKIFIGDNVSNVLWVPPLYTKTISHLIGKDAKLEDSTGALWTVSLSNNMGVLVFHKGWEKFAADHKLQLGDLLVFHYLNFGHFVVHIFDRTLVERTEFAYNIHLGKDTMTTEKIVVDTTSQRNASNGVSTRSIDRPGRNLFNARTRSVMGDGDNGFTDTEKSAVNTTPFQGNATKGLNFTDVGLRRIQPRTTLEMGDEDKGATKGVGPRNDGRPPKQARTCLEMGDVDKGASRGLSSRNVDRPSKQARADENLDNARTSLEMGGGDMRTTGTSKASRESSRTSFPIETNIETPLYQPSASYGSLKPKSVNEEQPCRDVADTTPSQRYATNGVSSRSVDHPSRQERPSRNLTKSRTNLGMGDWDNSATDTEKFAVNTSPFQGNATKCVKDIGCPSKQEWTDRNLDNAKSCLEMDGGDIRTTDTSEFNRESSRTSFPIKSNFETPLIHPSRSHGPLQRKSGNEEQPCLDDASCVIIDRSTYYAETEKKVVLYDLSVYERQNGEPISDKTCIAGDEGTHTRAQKFEASMTETNHSRTGFINSMTVSKLPETGMVQDTKASGHMDTTGMVQDTKASGHIDTTGTGMVQDTKASGLMDTTVMVQDTKASGHMDTTVMVQDTKASGHMVTTGMVQDTKASGHMVTTGNCSKSPLGRGNYRKSQLGNEFASPIPRQVHTMDTRNEIKVVKKEQVTLKEEARDHLRKPQDLNSSWTWIADVPSTSSLKRKAAKLEPEDSVDEPALFPDSITCPAVTDNCDYIKLPARLPSVAFKRVRGRIDNRCSILLIDPEKRKWPAIYIEKFGSFFGVICGWKQFNEANKVLPGDSYVFSLDNKSECWFKVDVVRS